MLPIDIIIDKPRPEFSQLRKVLLREGKPDYVPFYELFANREIMEQILERPVCMKSDQVEFYFKAGYDHVPTWPHFQMVTGNLVDTRIPSPICDWKSFEDYQWLEESQIDYIEFEEAGRAMPDGMMMTAQTSGPMEMLELLFGYQRLCEMLYDDPSLVNAVVDRITAIWIPMYRTMASFPRVGAIIISDDLGYKTQTLISVAHIREYILPLYRDLITIGHQYDKPVILHSCGNVYPLFDDLIDAGIDAKHSYEDAIMPVEDVYRMYYKRICILGGLDMDMICRSCEDNVRIRTRQLLNMGSSGAYALGTGNTVAPYVPLRNYLAMLDEGWKARKKYNE